MARPRLAHGPLMARRPPMTLGARDAAKIDAVFSVAPARRGQDEL